MAGKKISELTALGATFGATDLFEISKASGGGFVSRKITGAEMTSSLPGTTYTAGDGLDLTGTAFSTDLKSNGGLVIESTELAVDLGASSITGTLAVGDGGTGASTLTDGGILLGSGTGAVTAMAALGNGVIVVGDGSTDPTTITAFTASDGTLKHEIGGIETDISAITTGDILAGASAGTISIVAASGASDGDVLTIQADGTCDWEAGGGGGATDLNGLSDCETGTSSMFLGSTSADATQVYNTAVGINALDSLIAGGTYNTAVGYSAGTALTTADQNVLIGSHCATALTTGSYNVVVGDFAADGNTNMTQMTIVGSNAGSSLDDGAAYCTYIGRSAGVGGANASGTYNTAVGHQAMFAIQEGLNNVALGRNALYAIDDGDENVAIGILAGDGITTGGNNIFIGASADGVVDADNQIAIGRAISTTAANTLVLGTSGKLLLHGDFTTAGQCQLGINLGNTYSAPSATLHVKGEGATYATSPLLIENSAGTQIMKLTDAGDCIAIGISALDSITGGSGTYNIAIGENAGTALTESDHNVLIGRGAGAKISTGTGTNVMIGGYDVGGEITTEVANVMVGYQAGAACTSPSNTLVGHNAGKANSTAGCNTFIGDNAGTGATGQQNVAIGYFAANSASFSGNFNVAIGSQRQDFTSGTGNVEIGQGHSTTGSTTGSYNVAIGYLTGVSAADSNQIAIGNDIDTDGANKIRLGNASIATCNIQVDWTIDSDKRIKENITDGALGLDFINALRPVTFTKKHPADWDEAILEKRYKKGGSQYNDDADEKIRDEFDSTTVHDGLIAQEVKAAMESIGVDFSGWDIAGNGKQSIQYSKLVVPLIKAIQELSAKVKELENK